MTADEPGAPRSAAGLKPVLFLAIVIFAWGGNYTWVKLALADIGPWAFNSIRYGLAVVLLGLFLALRSGIDSLLPPKGERSLMAVIGWLQVAAMTGATTVAMTYIEAGRTVLIAYSMPIWAMLLSRLILGEKPSPAMILGAVGGLAGLALLFAPWTMDWTSRAAILGSLIVLAGTLCWALGAVLYRARRWTSDFWRQVFWQIATAALLLVPLGPLLETRPITATPTLIAILGWNAVVPSILGFWCWARALDLVPVATASQVLLLSPLFGVLLSAAVLGEPLTPSLLTAGALILAGAMLSYARRGRPRAAPD